MCVLYLKLLSPYWMHMHEFILIFMHPTPCINFLGNAEWSALRYLSELCCVDGPSGVGRATFPVVRDHLVWPTTGSPAMGLWSSNWTCGSPSLPSGREDAFLPLQRSAEQLQQRELPRAAVPSEEQLWALHAVSGRPHTLHKVLHPADKHVFLDTVYRISFTRGPCRHCH